MARVRLFSLAIAVLALTGCTTLGNGEKIHFASIGMNPIHLTGTLTLPKGYKAPVPVVVLVHGTAGVDSRYSFHRPALLKAGIGTFEVDFKTGIFTGPSDRPRNATFQPFAFGALKALRANPLVDPDRIAIMGFSLGGHLSVSVAAKSLLTLWLGPDQPGFAAHVGFYPGCKWLYDRFAFTEPTGAPILILAGDKDSYGDGENCPKFVKWLNEKQPGLVSIKIYSNVHHGFDRAGSWKGYDPIAINQTAVLEWHGKAARDSRQRAVSFLRQMFGL